MWGLLKKLEDCAVRAHHKPKWWEYVRQPVSLKGREHELKNITCEYNIFSAEHTENAHKRM